jgi:hypothetical protein
MKLSQESLSSIEQTIQSALSKYRISDDEEPNVVTDIHLQPTQASGELVLFDDDDNELAETTVEEWATYEADDFDKEAEHSLAYVLNRMKNNGAFERLSIMKPYSFVLVDEDKETISDLLLMDDDILVVNDELLKGLDEELDTFLKDLLND